MQLNLSAAMIRVLKLAVIHALKDGKDYTSREGDYEVDLNDAFDLLTVATPEPPLAVIDPESAISAADETL